MKMANGELLMSVDCLKNGNAVKNAIASMNRIAAKTGWKTRVVSVMSPDQVNWPGDFTSNWRNEFELVGKKALKHYLKRNNSGNLHSKILFQPYHSKKGSIQAVLTEVDSSKPSAVAVFTNTQKKSSALPAGFVSSMISRSGAPVFVVNAKAPRIKTVKTVAFATDFSDVDESSLKEAISFAKGMGAKLIILHVLPMVMTETMTAYAGITGGWNGFGEYLDVQEVETRKRAADWVKKAEASGVRAKFEIISNPKSIWSGIIKSSQRNGAQLIIMTEKTGPWESVLLGSVTRKVLEQTLTPVLVLPGREKQKSKKKRGA